MTSSNKTNEQLLSKAKDLRQQVKTLEDQLQASEQRTNSLFDDIPISLWEEDFSEVKQYIDNIRASGVNDLREHLIAHPDVVQQCAAAVKVLAVNQATLILFKAPDETALLGNLAQIFGPESYDIFREEILSLDVEQVFRSEIVNYTLENNPIYVSIQMAITSGYESTWSRVLVSLVDITERKQAEDALQQAHDNLEQRVEERTAELKLANAKRQRAHEFLRVTLEQTVQVVQRGAPQSELLAYLAQAQQQFDLAE